MPKESMVIFFWVVITVFFLVLIFNTSIMFPGGFDTSVQKVVFTGIITVVDGVFVIGKTICRVFGN